MPDGTYLSAPADSDGRAVPDVTSETEAFWQGLREGRLSLPRCVADGTYTFYPVGGCRQCGGGDLQNTEVSASGTVYTFTACYLGFGPGIPPPYVVAIIELDCQTGLRLMTNMVNCRIEDIRIGMEVKPAFIQSTNPLILYEPTTLPKAVQSEVRPH